MIERLGFWSGRYPQLTIVLLHYHTEDWRMVLSN